MDLKRLYDSSISKKLSLAESSAHHMQVKYASWIRSAGKMWVLLWFLVVKRVLKI